MGGSHDRAETDITDPILDEHRDIRSRFDELWHERASGDPGVPSHAAAWQPLANLLEEQASAENEEREAENPEPIEDGTGIMNWMFCSRKTGRITVAQLPNWPLAAWFLTSVVMWLGHPQGWIRAFLVVLSSAALALWAGGEVLRGVNPFRRLVGLATLGWLVFSQVRLG